MTPEDIAHINNLINVAMYPDTKAALERLRDGRTTSIRAVYRLFEGEKHPLVGGCLGPDRDWLRAMYYLELIGQNPYQEPFL